MAVLADAQQLLTSVVDEDGLDGDCVRDGQAATHKHRRAQFLGLLGVTAVVMGAMCAAAVAILPGQATRSPMGFHPRSIVEENILQPGPAAPAALGPAVPKGRHDKNQSAHSSHHKKSHNAGQNVSHGSASRHGHHMNTTSAIANKGKEGDVTTAPPANRSWMCHHYEDDQGDDWCRNAGVAGGMEFRFYGMDHSPCGVCWCCKRHVDVGGDGGDVDSEEKKIVQPSNDQEDAKDVHASSDEDGDDKEQIEHDMKYWIDKCSWSGDHDCSKKKCCNQEGYQCIQKDQYFAGCQLSAPDGWNGTVLGGFRAWEAQPAPKGKCNGHSLWCVAVVTTDEEQALLNAQKENGVGIFQCDAYSIFQGAPAPMGEWKSLANTDVFIDVWENQIKQDKKWRQYDWTVKVDIDLVFFPDRLRWHIDELCAPKNTGIYLKNTFFKWGFLGSLEVFSQQAMRMYYYVGWKCSQNIGHNSGEDGYMKGCMDALGVASMTDTTLLDDKYTRGGFSGWGPGDCQSGATVGFHPFKTEWIWETCHDSAALLSDPNRKCVATGCDR